MFPKTRHPSKRATGTRFLRPRAAQQNAALAIGLESLAFLLMLALALPAVAPANPGASPAAVPETEENWYRVEIGDTPAGWMVLRTQRTDGQLTSESELRLTFRRGTVEQSLEMESRFTESSDGRPLTAWARQRLGLLPVESSYRFTDDGVVLRLSQGNEAQERQLPLPKGEWLTPGQVEARLQQLLSSERDSFTLRTLDPLIGIEPVEISWTLVAREIQVELKEGPRKASRWRQSQSLAPQLESFVDIDADGLVLRSSTPIMGFDMVMTLSDRDDIVEPRESPEILVRSFIEPDRVLAAPRQTRRAVYELSLADSELLPNLPSVGDQRVKRDGARELVTVELGSSPRLAEPPDSERLLRSSLYLNHRDPRLRELLATATREVGDSDGERAEALRHFVHGYLTKKDLNSVLATATEVAQSRSGDCTEHSVLLTALLRAAGLPARVVIGLIYAETFAGERDIFGYHMWSQALVDGRWLDLDATLTTRFDAAHIALAVSDLDDDQAALADLAALVPLFGRLRVRILESED